MGRTARTGVRGAQAREGALRVDDLLGYRVFRLSQALARLAEGEARRAFGLNLAEYRCLALLASRREATVGGLCAELGIDKAWVSRMLQRLVAGGFVEAADDGTDARRRLYRPSAHGQQAARTLLRASRARQQRMLAGLSDAEATALMATLDRVLGNAAHEAGADAAGVGASARRTDEGTS
jgi:DNA-binding MarR family transcriptional regulator